MAFTEPTTFVHGDYPLAADLNKLSDNDTHFDQVIYPNIFGARYGSRICYAHTFRYLWFKGTGTIVDFAEVGDTVSISDDGTPTQYDLDSISWMAYGKVFLVVNADWSMERTD